MLTARRFTTVPTRDCRERLEAALSNQRPITRGESHKGAVAAIQYALADLNRGYLLPAEVDGFFGSRTYAAVEAFQRDYGLAADGGVGRQTLMQLDTLYSSDVIRQPRGMSIHVGLNRLDPGHYGNEFALSSCVNDARKMRDIAESIDYEAVVLEDTDATTSNFIGFMRSASSQLYAGDSLLVTFSGHGSQIPNNSADAEADNLDETLCFFDRMLLDDEFYALLGQFQEGVRVHAVFDSCHSGSVGKDPFEGRSSDELKELARQKYKEKTERTLASLAQPEAAAGGEEADRPYATKELSKALDGDRAAQADPPKPTTEQEANEDVATLFSDQYADQMPTEKSIKQMPEPDWTRLYKDNKVFYDAIANAASLAENQQLACSVITLSACQDSQTTQAGRVYSLFTYNFISAWGARGYEGSYQQFHSSLVSVSRSDSTPVISTYGANPANARLYDRPLIF